MKDVREEHDSLGAISVPKDCLWGAQTQRSLEHFSIGNELMPRPMIYAYALIKKAAALVHFKNKRLSKQKKDLIVKSCQEILQKNHEKEFPLHVWMTGSGTQFNMNINEVIANRCSQLAKMPLGSKKPVHPNDDVNLSQSSNDTFPTAMNVAAAIETNEELLPSLIKLKDSFKRKADQWVNIVKLGRTHYQDATPLTLGQEFSGYVTMLEEGIERIKDSLKSVYFLTLGGTAVGTGINAPENFDREVAETLALLTKLPFKTAPNKFAAQGAHDDLVSLSSALKGVAVSLYKISNDIRFLACGPRAGIAELILPSNEPGSSIMPGKVNPTQCEALSMVSLQVMANDFAVSMGGAGGHLEMNVYKPLIIHNILNSILLLKDSCHSFEKYCLRNMKPDLKKIKSYVEHSLMLVTALTPKIGYDKASQIAHYAMEHDLALKEAALKLGFISASEFDKLIDPLAMCHPQKRRRKR